MPISEPLDQDIENKAISELNHANKAEITDDTLLLVSVPGYDTETGYMSKFLKYGDLVKCLRQSFHLPENDYWLVNENGFKQLHVTDGLISDVGAGSDDYWLIDRSKTRRKHVVNGQIVDDQTTV